jgi:hypothetical protein
MKINFLLGSGVSIPAKLPGVGEITQRVLSGDRIRVGSGANARYQLDESFSQPMDADMQADARDQLFAILRLLERLRVHVHRRLELTGPREANYEDLAYIAGQIQDDWSDNRENPALLPFIENLMEDLKALPQSGDGHEWLGFLAGQAVDYIRDIVAGMLSQRTDSTQTGYLRFFADAVRVDGVAEVNLFTLNHDTLLETYLRTLQPAVRLIDGFGEEIDGIRRWNPMLYDAALGEKTRPVARLFKLHGSIDWNIWTPTLPPADGSAAWPDEFLGTRTNVLGGAPTKFGRKGEPVFLAGTFNKVASYNDGAFLDLHYRFHRTLAESEHLIVIGYGFGDKGVNQRIAEWMGASRTRRMLVIDPKSDNDLKQSARPAISGQIESWRTAQRFDHWDVGLDEADWAEAKKRHWFPSEQENGVKAK